MNFRQQLQEAYEAGYRSGLNEQEQPVRQPPIVRPLDIKSIRRQVNRENLRRGALGERRSLLRDLASLLRELIDTPIG